MLSSRMRKSRDTAGANAPEPDVIPALEYLKVIYERIHTNSERNTKTGHWINEAFVVRLWAVLEAHRIVGALPIDKTVDGANEVDLCRRLRNEIAHSKGRIDNKKALQLDRRLREVFRLGAQQSIIDGKFVLSKDTVLRPMHDACLRYSSAVLAKHTD